MPERACLRCGRPGAGRYCALHTPLPRDRTHAAQRRHARLRATGYCVACGSRLDLRVDHRVPLSRGGTNHPANEQLLCSDCHDAKTLADRLL